MTSRYVVPADHELHRLTPIGRARLQQRLIETLTALEVPKRAISKAIETRREFDPDAIRSHARYLEHYSKPEPPEVIAERQALLLSVSRRSK